MIGALAFALLCPSSSPRTESVRSLMAVGVDSKPAFALPAVDGSRQALQSFAGKVVLVHFFATWCEPCREEFSSLARLLAEPRGAPLSVLAVSVAEVPVRVSRFLATQPVPFPVVLDADRSVSKAWSVTTLPTTFVLDRELEPRLFVEGDIDWLRPDVLAALERVGRTSRHP